jgi:hypothetical protein
MLLIASIYKLSENDIFAFAGLIFTIAGTTVVLINYIIQITYIPSLVANATEGNDLMISMCTMANQHSLSWVLEMWASPQGGVGGSCVN